MRDRYNSPDFDEYTYYVMKARSLRAEQWRRFFAAMFRAPAWVLGKAASAFTGNSDGGRVAS